jgi:hypothetical protein
MRKGDDEVTIVIIRVSAGEQALPEVGEVSVGVSGRSHALVHLDDMHVGPRHGFLGYRMQHLPRGGSSAQGHDEAPADGHSSARFGCGERGSGSRDGFGIDQRFDLHAELTVGFCQPPGGPTLESTSVGPQVPGSYSQTGVSSFSTGSTIRQASST